jgi:phosphatidylserine/phosphatidylglycerophosphate/cardiolipin synthase-like enzyme
MAAAQGMSPQQVMVIDGEMLMTGRVNGTKAAQEKTAEPVLIVRGPALAVQYMPNWDAHRRHRQPSVGRGVRESWRRGRQRQELLSSDNGYGGYRDAW